MAKRKTISVADLLADYNKMLRESVVSKEMRKGILFAAEQMLMTSGNYKGFRYLLASEVPQGERPGVNYEVNAKGHFVPCEDYNERFLNTDETRVQYFI